MVVDPRQCITPEEGWSCYSHFIGNSFTVIESRSVARSEETEIQKNSREWTVLSAWSGLVGNLYMVMRSMRLHGHNKDADRMQQVLDLVVDGDLSRPEDRQAVMDKQEEFDTVVREFRRSWKGPSEDFQT